MTETNFEWKIVVITVAWASFTIIQLTNNNKKSAIAMHNECTGEQVVRNLRNSGIPREFPQTINRFYDNEWKMNTDLVLLGSSTCFLSISINLCLPFYKLRRFLSTHIFNLSTVGAHCFGFESSGFSAFSWIWILQILLNRIWIW